MLDSVTNTQASSDALDSAEMGAIAHLYRGEVYRSTIWRTRLDNTTLERAAVGPISGWAVPALAALCNASRHLTGQFIAVDGGASAV